MQPRRGASHFPLQLTLTSNLAQKWCWPLLTAQPVAAMENRCHTYLSVHWSMREPLRRLSHPLLNKRASPLQSSPVANDGKQHLRMVLCAWLLKITWELELSYPICRARNLPKPAYARELLHRFAMNWRASSGIVVVG